MNSTWSALILTGGTSKRFGSDKSEALIDGRALIDHVLDSISAEVPVIVVGPRRDNFPSRVAVIQEQPVHAGPVAGIAAGMTLVTTEFVALLATDMPYAGTFVPQLLAKLSESVDGVVAVDVEGFVQPFCGVYRVKALMGALSDMGILTDESMRNLLSHLKLSRVNLEESSRVLVDIDTQEDLQRTGLQ